MTENIKTVLIAVLFSLQACSTASTEWASPEADYHIYLVRHAEKERGTDPGLTVAGRERAQFFTEWLKDKNILSIWSSDFKRTLESARPLADNIGVEIELYDPRNQQELIEQLQVSRVNALVVGHSNTIPALAAMLCQCGVDPLADTQYERSFVIIVTDGHSAITEINQTRLWTNR